jgi:hypothetical protein
MKNIIIALLVSLISVSANAKTTKWTYNEQVDDFNETVKKYIVSQTIIPNKPLSFPYTDPKIYMYYDCKSKNFIMHNSASNLLGLTPQEGDYSSGMVTVKVDGTINKYAEIKQSWGSNFIHIMDQQYIPDSPGDAETEFVIQLHHYNDGLRHYTFNMTGIDYDACPDGKRVWKAPPVPNDAYVKVVNPANGEIVYYNKFMWNSKYKDTLGHLDFLEITILK